MQLTARFTDALAFAATLHAAQVRKVSATPYVGHLLAVCGIVLEYGGGENEAVAALLHDSIEDQGGSAIREELVRRFGTEVVEIIDGCTDADRLPKPPWRQRKQQHVARLRHASASICLVVAADKLDNVHSLLHEYRLRGESLWSHFNGGREGTLWYYRAVTDAIRHAVPSPLWSELDRSVAELERLSAGSAA